MGADLIVAVLATDKPDELDFDAGRAFISNIDLSTVRESEFVEYLPEGEDTGDEELREELEAAVHNLEEAFENSFRDQTLLTFGRWHLYLSGGTSWGDSPGPTFDAMMKAEQVPGLVESIGFGWPGINDETIELDPLVVVRGGVAFEHAGSTTIVDMDDALDDLRVAGIQAIRALEPYGDATRELRAELTEALYQAAITDPDDEAF